MATSNISINDAIQIITHNLVIQNGQVVCDHLKCYDCPVWHLPTNVSCVAAVTEAVELTKPLLLTNPELFV